MRILFGEHKDREPLIRAGFAGSPHEIVFRPLQGGGLKDFDLVVPLTVDEVLFLDSQRESLAASLLPLPEREVVELCDDKPRLSRTRFTPEFQSILRFIGFNGLCCVNYKLRNERPVILEINPCFGASLCPFSPCSWKPRMRKPEAFIRISH